MAQLSLILFIRNLVRHRQRWKMPGLICFNVSTSASDLIVVYDVLLSSPSPPDSNIRLYEHEMNEDFRDNPGLARLSDGSGIYGTVAAFHSIHCIKRLRYLLHFDHYHANVTKKQATGLKLHGGMA